MSRSVVSPGSVFSFHPPDDALPGSATLEGPQFGVQNTTTSVARLNDACALLYTPDGIAADGSAAGSTGTQVDLTAWAALAATPSMLVDQLDAAMTHATITVSGKAALVTAVDAIAASDTLGRACMAVHLVAGSPRDPITR